MWFIPLILQLSKELSLFMEFEVEIIQSYFDLIKWDTLLDLKLVIHFELLLIVKKSFDIAIFASIRGSLLILFR